MKSTVYKTERLILKPMNLEDADFFLELVNAPKWKQFIGDRKVNSKLDAENYIKNKMLPQYERLGYGNFAVIRKSDTKKIGTCGLYDREGIEGVDIGFAFLPQYEKKGYAFEASEKVKEIGIKHFSIKKISGITLTANKSSQKLLEKLGLEFKKMIKLPEDTEELMLYELII